MARWHAVLIANTGHGRNALRHAVRDAELVGRALLRCGFCATKQDLHMVLNQTGDEIKKKLEQVIQSLPADAQLFVWYSGHGYARLAGASQPESLRGDQDRQQNLQGTFLVPDSQIDFQEDEEGHVGLVETIRGLWLEDTLLGIIASEGKEQLKLWCVVVACRPLDEAFRSAWTRQAHRYTVKMESIEHAEVKSFTRQRWNFLYACKLGEFMLDCSTFAKSFCYNLECNPGSLDALKRNLATDIELMSFGHLCSPQMIHMKFENPLQNTKLVRKQARRKVLYDSDWVEAIQQVKLVADCLHQLADIEMFGEKEDEGEEEEEEEQKESEMEEEKESAKEEEVEEEEEEEDEEEGEEGEVQKEQEEAEEVQVETEEDSYDQYLFVRGKAVKIINKFYKCADHFKTLEDQIELLSCDFLDEAIEALTDHQAPSESTGGYPCCSAGWEPEDWTNAEGLIHAHRGMLNLPDKVIHVICKALKGLEEQPGKFASGIILEILQRLGSYFTVKKYAKLPVCQEEEVKKHMDKLNKYFFVSEGVLGVTEHDANEIAKELKDRCEELCLTTDDLKVIQEMMRVYVSEGSFWVIVVSSAKLNQDRLKSILEDFVDQRRSTSLGWACAEAPYQVPHFAAPGLQTAVDLVEGLRAEIQVPNLVPLRGSFFKGLARQLIQRNGEEAAEWQVRVVNNYRDLEDHDWLNPHCNVDLHFVQSLHWPTLPWETPELLERLKTFAGLRPQSQVLHVVAFLIHAIQKDLEWLGMLLGSECRS
ncbi:unnamed protein product [Durusdinium trenchii]|uniref:Peptidase C14 caspase domain-containing protein n=1 Tax=Durusdinium trenchii TaxID=1381693 RepID=A0ABP0LSE6_9DINO